MSKWSQEKIADLCHRFPDVAEALLYLKNQVEQLTAELSKTKEHVKKQNAMLKSHIVIYDIKEKRIAELQAENDSLRETNAELLAQAAELISKEREDQ